MVRVAKGGTGMIVIAGKGVSDQPQASNLTSLFGGLEKLITH